MAEPGGLRVLRSLVGPLAAKQQIEALESEGATFYRWSNQAGDEYRAHRHGYHKIIIVDRGSIIFHLPESDRSIELRAGDRLDLPAGILHAASVGDDGVACLETHLQ